MDDKSKLPLLKMELTFDDEKMEFYPPSQDLEETVLFVVKQICKTMQQVPTVQSWLGGGSTLTHTDASIPEHILQKYTSKLKSATVANFEEPQALLQSFGKLKKALMHFSKTPQQIIYCGRDQLQLLLFFS